MIQLIVAKDSQTTVILEVGTFGIQPPKVLGRAKLNRETHAKLFEAVETATNEVAEEAEVSFITISATRKKEE